MREKDTDRTVAGLERAAKDIGPRANVRRLLAICVTLSDPNSATFPRVSDASRSRARRVPPARQRHAHPRRTPRDLALVDVNSDASRDPQPTALSAPDAASERRKDRRCRTHENPPPRHAQERQNINPASSLQQLRTPGDPLPRDHHASHQAPLRVRPCFCTSSAYPLTPSRRSSAPSFPSRYGTVPETRLWRL